MDEFKYLRSSSDLSLQDNGKKLEGYAVVYGSMSEEINEGGRRFREIIKPGAATQALRAKDIRAVYEHDPRQLLGRTSSGTLSLKEDAKGVFYSLDLPNTRLGNDVREMVSRGDLRGASLDMRLRPSDHSWKRANGEIIHEINGFSRIAEITLTSEPAYAETSAVLRSLIEWEQQEQTERVKQVPLIVRLRKLIVEGL